MPPSMTLKYLRAKKQCRKEERPLMPKDLFKLKGFLCAGTDNRCYKDDLEELWGVRPVEVFAGTEPSICGHGDMEPQRSVLFPGRMFL